MPRILDRGPEDGLRTVNIRDPATLTGPRPDYHNAARPETTRELIYLAPGGRTAAVTVQTNATFAAGNPEVLFEGNYYFGTAGRSYDVAPDGERFLMIKVERQSVRMSVGRWRCPPVTEASERVEDQATWVETSTGSSPSNVCTRSARFGCAYLHPSITSSQLWRPTGVRSKNRPRGSSIRAGVRLPM